MASNSVRSWNEIKVGAFGIPDTATHFRWKVHAGKNVPMADGNKMYDLHDDNDRPLTRPVGSVLIYPLKTDSDTGETEGYKLDNLLPGQKTGVNTIRREFILVEFTDPNKEGTSGELVTELLRMLKNSVELNNKPSDAYQDIINRLTKETEQMSTYIKEMDNSAFSKFLRDHPELAKVFLETGIDLAKSAANMIKLKVVSMAAQLDANKGRKPGEIDVTPTTVPT